MNFPRISERTFSGLSLAGSIIIIITTSIWFSQADPERFGITLIAGMLMLGSANLVYVLLSHRLRPATVAGSVWITTILWLLFMMAVDSADSHNDPYSPNYDHHGSGFLWLGLPVFYVGSLIASIIATAARPKLLSLEKSSLQAFWASMRWSFIGTTGLLWIFSPIALLVILGIVLLINRLVDFIDSSTASKRPEGNTSDHSNLSSDS
ncbi:hypothetical protein [Neisseria sicca]|jgi:hypothetical protein|uniref:hypothetical protein n=1 Tax=Neisseria sicca TaxID=490 RepID=UPI000D314F25|nr:hypothetical protein [Neisseria sicca]MBF1285345.1 hypothetical protein [Neisseria sp.]